jgi:hypothetical protein
MPMEPLVSTATASVNSGGGGEGGEGGGAGQVGTPGRVVAQVQTVPEPETSTLGPWAGGWGCDGIEEVNMVQG